MTQKKFFLLTKTSEFYVLYLYALLIKDKRKENQNFFFRRRSCIDKSFLSFIKRIKKNKYEVMMLLWFGSTSPLCAIKDRIITTCKEYVVEKNTMNFSILYRFTFYEPKHILYLLSIDMQLTNMQKGFCTL